MFAQKVVGQGQDSGQGIEVQTVISFARENPYEVVFHFPQVTHDDTDWIFGRDLLVEALENGSAGVGDVRISVEGAEFSVTLQAMSNSGGIQVTYGTEEIRSIVERFLGMVPLGEESAKFVEVLGDEEIQGWLAHFEESGSS